MGLFKRLSGLLGFSKDDDHHNRHDDEDEILPDATSSSNFASTQHLPRKGFSVAVPVPVERSAPAVPLLLPCPAGDGGLQGLRWYAKRLKIDEDGDIADEFLVEVVQEDTASSEESVSVEENNNKPLTRFEVNKSTKPANVRNQVLLPNGKIQHQVEYQGRLEWL